MAEAMGRQKWIAISRVAAMANRHASVVYENVRKMNLATTTLDGPAGKPALHIPTEDAEALVEILNGLPRKPRGAYPEHAASPRPIIVPGSKQEWDVWVRRGLQLCKLLGIDEVVLRDGKAEITKTVVQTETVTL